MKRLLFFVAGCLMIACNMTDDVENQIVSKKLFHATIDDESTRTFVDEKIRLRWTEGDLISLFEGTTRNKQYKFLGETGDNAGDFEDITTGFGSGNDIDRHYAIYPYSSTTKLHEDGYITYTFPAEQNYAENSFGLGANPMVAVTGGLDDFDLCFRNAAGYLRLYLYGDDATIKSIKIEGNNSEPLAGKAYITPEFGGFPTTEMDETATTSVTLNCGEGVKIGSTAESSTPFWVVLPPTTFAEGFTLTITDTNDNEFTKSFTSNVNIQRNKYISAKIEVEFPKPVPNNQIWYTATAKVAPYNTNVFGANIVSNEWKKATGEGVIIFDGEVTSIGEGAFKSREALTSITIPDGVTSIGSYAFYRCSALKSVTIPDSVTKIGEYAFSDCALTSITIPDGVTSIGGYAFQNCKALTSITIPDSVTSFGQSTFYQCTGELIINCNIPSPSVISGDGVFCSSKFTSVIIGDSVTTIGDSAFYSCPSITSLTLGNGVTSIGKSAFSTCSNITSVTIPDSVKTIGDYAFNNCKSLTSITIGNSVTKIGESAFSACSSLKSVNITDLSAWCKIDFVSMASNPLHVAASGNLYLNNELVTELVIPGDITEIKSYAFLYCKSLTSVTIPECVTAIGAYVFRGCDNLTSVYCKAVTPPTGTPYMFNFSQDSPDLNIYVPTDSVSAYKNAWQNFKSQIVGYDF